MLPSMQPPSRSSVLGSVVLGREQGTDASAGSSALPLGTERWVGADVSMVKSPSFWAVQGCPLASSHQEVPTRKC